VVVCVEVFDSWIDDVIDAAIFFLKNGFKNKVRPYYSSKKVKKDIPPVKKAPRVNIAKKLSHKMGMDSSEFVESEEAISVS
jgi:hypothetical protein